MENEKIKGHLAAICANLIYGLNINAAKSLLADSWMTPMGLTITRMFMAALMFWIISLFIKKEKTGLKDLLIFALGALTGMVFALIAFAIGLQYISPVTWSLISALSPIIVLLLAAVFLSEAISLKKAVGVVIGILGAVFILIQNKNSGTSTDSLLGIVIAVLSVTSYAVYMVIMRKASLKFSPVTMMKWMYLWAFIFLSPLCIPDLPKQRLFSPEASLQPLLLLGYIVFLTSGLAFFLIPVALKRIKATATSIYICLQPIAASTAAIISGQDVFSWDKLLALIIVITGITIVTQSKSN